MQQTLNPETIYISKDIYMGDLKPTEKAIYLLLTQNINHRFTVSEISRELCLDKSHTRKYLQRMEKLKVIYLIKYKNKLEVLL